MKIQMDTLTMLIALFTHFLKILFPQGDNKRKVFRISLIIPQFQSGFTNENGLNASRQTHSQKSHERTERPYDKQITLTVWSKKKSAPMPRTKLYSSKEFVLSSSDEQRHNAFDTEHTNTRARECEKDQVGETETEIKRNDAFQTAYVVKTKNKNKVYQTIKAVAECVHLSAGLTSSYSSDKMRTCAREKSSNQLKWQTPFSLIL